MLDYGKAAIKQGLALVNNCSDWFTVASNQGKKYELTSVSDYFLTQSRRDCEPRWAVILDFAN